MKRNNKRKGFTIVELVIVIAVIAILAGVLIPTFAGIVEKANVSKALQEAKNAYTNDLALLDGQATNYMKLDYKVEEYTLITTEDKFEDFDKNETYFNKEDYKSLTINNEADFTTAQEKYTTLYTTDGTVYTAAPAFVTGTTTYYAKDVYNVATTAPTAETFDDGNYYYRESICAGTFSGENYTTYTITVDDEYVCTFDGNDWTVIEKTEE